MKYSNENNDIFNQIQANILHIQTARQMQSNNDKCLNRNDYGNIVDKKNNPPVRQKEKADSKYYSSSKFQIKSNAPEKQKDKSMDRKHKQQPGYPQQKREMLQQRMRTELLNGEHRGNREHNTIDHCGGSRTPTKHTAQIRKTPTHTPTRPRTPDYDRSDNQRIQRTPDGRARQKKMNINTNDYDLHHYDRKSPLKKKDNFIINNAGNQYTTNNNNNNNNNNTNMYNHSNNCNSHLYTNANQKNTGSNLYTNSNAVTTAGNKNKKSNQVVNKHKKMDNNPSQRNSNLPLPHHPSTMQTNKEHQHQNLNQNHNQQTINLELRKQHSQGKMYFPNHTNNNNTNVLETNQGYNPQYGNQPNNNPLPQKKIPNNGYKHQYTNTNNQVFESFGKPMSIPYPQTETQRIPKQTNKAQVQQDRQPAKRNIDFYQTTAITSNNQRDLHTQTKPLSQKQSATKKFQPNSFYKLPEEEPKIDFNELDQFSPPFTGQLNVNYNDPRMFSPILTTNYSNIELSKDKHSTLNPSDNHKRINDFISKINTNDKKYSTIEYQQLKYDYHKKTSSMAGVSSLNYQQYKPI